MESSFLKGRFVDNSESTLKRLLSLYRNSTLSDVQLLVGGVIFSAHKLILSMCSDVFKTMLTDTKWPEASKDLIALTEEPECADVFEEFVEYMYTGHIHLTNQTVLPVLTLADKYNVKELSETCVLYMCENIDAIGINLRVVSWLQYARLCNYHNLEAVCAQYTEWNFEKVAQSADFLTMNASTLLEFLSSSDLVVHSEFSLFLNLKRWLLKNRAHCRHCPHSKKRLVERVINSVRFRMMTDSQLQLLCQDGFVHEYTDVFDAKLMDAFDYHSVPADKCTIKSDQGETYLMQSTPCQKVSSRSAQMNLSKPRNYTCDDWSSELVLENFASLDDFTMRPFFFSTPVSSSAADEHVCWDWQVDLYPKGILFHRSIMIGLSETYDIDQHERLITRVGVIAKSDWKEVRNVEICVLAKAAGPSGSEYVKRVTKKKCIFDFDGCIHNLDSIVPYDELLVSDSVYLIDKDRSTFKIVIIIKPLR